MIIKVQTTVAILLGVTAVALLVASEWFVGITYAALSATWFLLAWGSHQRKVLTTRLDNDMARLREYYDDAP